MSYRFLTSAKSDKGKVRASNQDSGYSGNNLFIVADGMGGHAGGDIASAMATQHVAKADDVYEDDGRAIEIVAKAMREANDNLIATVKDYPYLQGMGTTMDTLVFTGNQANIIHIGDSRVYLSRGGNLIQITKDHTFVQKLVDSGRITEEEALYHPKRNVLMKVLGDSYQEPEFDIHQIEVMPGDRFLLCSDGLCGFVPTALIEENLKITDLEEASDLLIAEAKEYGAPDNVTVLIIEVKEAGELTEQASTITWLGSAANEVVISQEGSNRFLRIFNKINFANSFRKRDEFLSESDPQFAKAIQEFDGRVSSWRRRGIALGVIITLLLGGALWGFYSYTQTRFYLGVENGKVAIYQGIKESFAGFGFSHLVQISTLDVATLPDFQKELLGRTISADSLDDAKAKLQQIVESITNG